MKEHATIFRIGADEARKELPLYIPYWALNFEELLSVTFGDVPNDADRGGIIERVTEKKLRCPSQKNKERCHRKYY